MKSTTFVAILLTFLMLLLVLAGAITFLWQDRQETAVVTTRLHTEKVDLEATSTIVRSYLTAREEGLATAQASGTATALELAQAEANNQALEGTREGLLAEQAHMATRTASLEEVLLQPPSIAIISPRPDTVLLEETASNDEQVVVAASHPQGISALRITLGGQEERFTAAGEPLRVFTYTLPSPLAPDLYTVTATITATNNLTATATTTFRVLGGEDSGNPESGYLPLPGIPLPVTDTYQTWPTTAQPRVDSRILKAKKRFPATRLT